MSSASTQEKSTCRLGGLADCVPRPCQDYQTQSVDVSKEEAARRLDTLFPPNTWPGGKVLDRIFYEVSHLLRVQGLPSTNPRLYMMLRLLGKPDALETFTDKGITDLCFPLSPASLPTNLEPSIQSAFLRRQWIVVSGAVTLEQGAVGEHQSFGADDLVPFETQGHVNDGAHGAVDLVKDAVTGSVYARKRIQASRRIMETLSKEIASLKRLQHRHVVKLVGTYTDPVFAAFIISPVAYFNLEQYLDAIVADPSGHRLSVLGTFFGCLVNGLVYMHQNSVRHAHIKTSNILVKGESVLYTNLGLVFDWADMELRAAQKKYLGTYTAPELRFNVLQDSAADIWSLGCVFAEIDCVLRGEPTAHLRDFLVQYDSGDPCSMYAAKIEAIDSYLSEIHLDNVPLSWVKSMLKEEPHQRPTAAAIQERILNVDGFVGKCCNPDVQPPLKRRISSEEPFSPIAKSRKMSSETSQDTAAFQNPLEVMLFKAVHHGHAGYAQAALDQGANPNALDWTGNTPLHNSITNPDPLITALLLTAGAHPHLPNARGLTPLHLATSTLHLPTITLLLSTSASPTLSHPLTSATWRGSTPIVSALLAAGADPNIPNTTTSSPIHLAAYCNHPHVLALLLSHGANVHAVDPAAAHTPFHAAALRGNTACIAALLAAGADPGARTQDGRTALDVAAIEGHVDAVGALVGCVGEEARGEAMVHAVCAGRVGVVRGLWARGVGRGDGVGLLVAAVRAGQEHVVEWLVGGAGVGVGERDGEGRTALEWAVAEGRGECVEVLVGLGAGGGQYGEVVEELERWAGGGL